MKVSIITATMNSEATVEDTLKSVAEQDYADIEHIVVDGVSTDSTIEIVRRHGADNVRIISEPDKGLYDAMNKGIALATGDLIGILNSDDIYSGNRVVSTIVDHISSSGASMAYGDLAYVRRDDTSDLYRTWKSSDFEPGAFRLGWHPPHPTLFVKKEIYRRYGAFDLSFDVSADFELMLRLFEVHRVASIHVREQLVYMREGGVSGNSLRNIVRGNLNCIRAFRKNGVPVGISYPLRRLLPKLRQFTSSGYGRRQRGERA